MPDRTHEKFPRYPFGFKPLEPCEWIALCAFLLALFVGVAFVLPVLVHYGKILGGWIQSWWHYWLPNG